MPQNLIEKIAQRFTTDLDPGRKVHSGDYISIQPAYVMTHDNTGAVIPKFRRIGATKLADPHQVVLTLDHDIQNKSQRNLTKYARIEAFAQEMGADFYPAGRGIGHQIMVEEGYAWPGTMVVASDSHSNMYGGIGCLGTPIVRTDAAAIWATGRTWWQVPAVAKVELQGRLRSGVAGKDIIIGLCGFFNQDEVLNQAVEFVGDGLVHLTVDERLTIANMTTEWGALAGIFPIDEITLQWLRKRAAFVASRRLQGVPTGSSRPDQHPRINEQRIAKLEQHLPDLRPDPEAYYATELRLDLGSIQPYVSGPNSVKVMTPIVEMRARNLGIDKAYLVSCVNSRVEDIAQAANIVRGRKVASGVELYIAAASSEVQTESQKRGDWQALTDAGAIALPPGCGPCIGLGLGLLRAGEVGISATNRNFRGRMGSPKAETYLASPAVVAASAVAGKIDYPGNWEAQKPVGTFKRRTKTLGQRVEIQILDGFPESLVGELIFCHQDNLNTDGIFPGKYTYNDDITPLQQGQVVMENYDPAFGQLVKRGDILVGGFNFGTGSSREQAATALKYRGLALVLAGSFSETYRRNALNNGFLTIEAPELVSALKEKFGSTQPTLRTGIEACIDFRNAVLRADGGQYSISPIGPVAQDLVVTGGLENWVRKRLGVSRPVPEKTEAGESL